MKKVVFFSAILILVACNAYKDLPNEVESPIWKTQRIPEYPQQEGGDPEAGYEYLIYGDYIGTGMPLEFGNFFKMDKKDTVLRRTGDNAYVAYAATIFEGRNGAKVVNGNCFACHASEFNGEIVIGLGNSFSAYEKSLSGMAKIMNFMVDLKFKDESKEWKDFEDFGRYFKAMAPKIETNQPGANPAFRLAEACMMHRDPVDLTYTKEPQYEMIDYPVATDVPPLWNVGKKNALYYVGVGRGDFTKLLIQASVLGVPDSTAARNAATNFKDVLAWLNQLEPPKYPGPIDEPLAASGQEVFEDHCSKCHGTYGEEETYPNKIVSLDVVQTDPLYVINAQESGIVEWYNKSWFATSEPQSYFEVLNGYVAPPLDGVWATAPYLHNGSVPTLAELLESSTRPTYWKRSGDSRDYNYNKVGWNYEKRDNRKGKWTFDTTLPGYSNKGHYFGDDLTTDERTAVIEYLKTL